MITFADLFDRLPFTLPLTIVVLAATYLMERGYVVFGTALIVCAALELSVSRLVGFFNTYSVRRAKKANGTNKTA